MHECTVNILHYETSNIGNNGVHLLGAQALVKLLENAAMTIPAVFTFGDSTFDTGNNNNRLTTMAKCNFSPYGRDFMGGKATGRCGNGKIPSDLIVEQLGIKQLLPAYLDPDLQTKDLLSGVNFASSAAGYDPLTSKITSAISLSDQLEMFKKYIKEVKKLFGEKRLRTINNITDNSLFVVAAGSDDIANTYFLIRARMFQYNISAYADFLVHSASVWLQDLYGLGARRIGVLSAPPIGCLPSQRTLGGGAQRNCVGAYNQAAQLFNSKLSKLIKNLNKKLPNGRIVYLDVYTPLNDMIKNPKKYGFEVANKGCCGTGKIEAGIFMCNQWNLFTCTNVSKYVFWDSFHPTEKAYKVLWATSRLFEPTKQTQPNNYQVGFLGYELT
ncbi:hypothetical protein Dsin_003756 [Dipteronia sinensis]|uniref:GDSL esterase/lipase EXL3 n=1 Tax=Dipteronia sinensis TaxID=43782 RepID=A0AAE0B9Q5_9ROSI|nr:hypothetical protein Dsin_003756 [Dipteronia sinensis]